MNDFDWDAHWALCITPMKPFPYATKMTGHLNTRDGMAWTANLYRKGVLIGEVSNQGQGGADDVWIMDPTEQAKWKKAVEASFMREPEKGFYWVEEYATAYLAEQEEKHILSKGVKA